jgi:integrase/recombinase XerD
VSPRSDTMADLLITFLEWLQIKNYTARTVKNRRQNMIFFIKWCADRGLVTADEITKPIIERYQRFLFYYRKRNGRPLAARTQHERLVTVQYFFRWLSRKNLILSNPASDIELPKLPLALPRDVLTAREAEKVINQPDVTDPMGIRDRAILETLYSTGMRRFELTSLTIHSIDLDGLTVMIRRGKGMKDRLVPIGERAVNWVEKYLFEVRPELVTGADEGFLFLTVHGGPFAPDSLSRLVTDYVKQSRVGKKGSCHLFRHTMATTMLENGADIRIVQLILGHSRLETTQIYTHLNINHLKEVHIRTHPATLKSARKQRQTA